MGKAPHRLRRRGRRGHPQMLPNTDVLEIMIASRTKSKCDAIKKTAEGRTPPKSAPPRWTRTTWTSCAR